MLLRGCSLACSLHAPSLGACILPPSALPTPTRDGKVNTRGRRPVCLRTRIPEALAQGDSFPGGSQFLCTFSSHLPRTELLVTPHPGPFLSSSKLAAWNALESRFLGCSHWGASVGKSQVEAIEFQLQLSEKKKFHWLLQHPSHCPPTLLNVSNQPYSGGKITACIFLEELVLCIIFTGMNICWNKRINCSLFCLW